MVAEQFHNTLSECCYTGNSCVNLCVIQLKVGLWQFHLRSRRIQNIVSVSLKIESQRRKRSAMRLRHIPTQTTHLDSWTSTCGLWRTVEWKYAASKKLKLCLESCVWSYILDSDGLLLGCPTFYINLCERGSL